MSAISFLGIIMKAGKLETGDESVAIAARAGKAKVILTASDAGRSTLIRAENAGRAAGCPVISLPATKSELGAVTGRELVGVAAVTDIGMASAFVSKLSAQCQGLEDTAGELSRLAQRAEQRKKELRRHEQKLRRGKK